MKQSAPTPDNFEPKGLAEEVFSNYDYEAKSKEERAQWSGVIGTFARLASQDKEITKLRNWLKTKPFKRMATAMRPGRATQAETPFVAGIGSAAELMSGDHVPPQPIASRPGVYRSIHAMRTSEGPGSIDNETAEIMTQALHRARAALGEQALDMSTPAQAAEAGEPQQNEYRPHVVRHVRRRHYMGRHRRQTPSKDQDQITSNNDHQLTPA